MKQIVTRRNYACGVCCAFCNVVARDSREKGAAL
jgi:hypothetical protein